MTDDEKRYSASGGRSRWGLSHSIGRLLCSLLVFYLASPCAWGKESILVLNSDMNVQKYLTVQTEFKSRLGIPQVEIDLGRRWVDESRIEEAILDEDPDIIYCIGSRAYLLAHKLARDKSLIFSSAINWQRFPMTQDTYGVANELPPGMQLMMYRYFFPEISKIAVLYSEINKEWLETATQDAKQVGIEIIGRVVSKPDQVVTSLVELLPQVDALWLISDPIVLSNEKAVRNIFAQTDAAKNPVFAYNEAFATYGAVMVISADVPTIGRQVAQLTVRILENRKIDERIQSPAGTHIIANLRKIEEYGIELNVEALDSVNRIIK